MRFRFVVVAALPTAAACFVSQSNTQVSGGVTGDTKGGCSRCGPGGDSAGGTGTSNGGTSGGGTSGGMGGGGGSTGAADAGCETISGLAATPFECIGVSPSYDGGAGSCQGDWFGTAITNYFSCQPDCGISFYLLDQNGVQIPGYSQASDPVTGFVHLCLQDGLTYTPAATGTNYKDFYYGEIQGQLGTDIPSLGVFPQSDFLLLQTFISGLDLSKGSAILYIYSISGACGSSAQSAGWTFSLAFPDGGGAYPDGSYEMIYLDENGEPSTTLTQTSGYGAAFVINIDPTLGSFVVPVYGNADAGPCAVENEALGFTGRLYVTAGNFSQQAVFVP